MRKILVLRGGALGDFIVTLPALALLRQRWPEARIELIGNVRAAELARARGLLDAAHSQHEARWSGLFGTAPLSSSLAAWLAGFDLVLNYWPDPDGVLRARFPVRVGQTVLHAAAMPGRTPAAAHYCEPLRALGLAAISYFYPLGEIRETAFPTSPQDAKRPGTQAGTEIRPHPKISTVQAGSFPSPIAIHPGSGSPKKNWPAERWRETIAALPSHVLLILGEVEHVSWSESVLASVDRERVKLAVNLPLEQLTLQLSQCRLFLGHDSGVSHLAAACGVPCVLLFGPTDPAMWAPPAPHVRVLRRGPSLEAIPVTEVLAAALGHRG